MNEQRRKELYAQLRAILMELLWDRKPSLVIKQEQGDDSVLRIYANESIGTSERMVH